ncbi:hypothetical protein NL676_023834 [Syzygium grande]|nr:hypothetical protein NL676_023834 [Syzygium grande]
MVSYGRARVNLDLKLPQWSGHYASNCEEVPFSVEDVNTDEDRLFGSWLKSEVSNSIPFRKLFHGKDLLDNMEEESILETPIHPGQLVIYEESSSGPIQQFWMNKEDSTTNKPIGKSNSTSRVSNWENSMLI